MSTDRELLELAAKAAGITDYLGAWFDDGGQAGFLSGRLGNGRSVWNPLTDDGDALRLAVKLGLVVSIDIQLGGETEAWPYADMGDCADERHRGDPYAATRRAIVRAAAQIGRAML